MSDKGSSVKEPLLRVPVADLMRVTPFMATEDIRYYLNGVLVSAYEDHALLVATNGHWMAIYESREARTDRDRILALPSWFASQVRRLHEEGSLEDISDDEDEEEAAAALIPKQLIVAEEQSRLIIEEVNGREVLVKPGLAFVEGKFPDWAKVIPDFRQYEAGIFAPVTASYLAGLHEAVPDEREHPLFCYHHRADPAKPVVFRFGNLPELVIVLMPRRDDASKPKEWPKWLLKS